MEEHRHARRPTHPVQVTERPDAAPVRGGPDAAATISGPDWRIACGNCGNPSVAATAGRRSSDCLKRVIAGSAPLQWRSFLALQHRMRRHWSGALPAMNLAYDLPSSSAFSRWKSSTTASITARTRGSALRSRCTSSHWSAKTSSMIPPTRFSTGSGSPR
jgi:hypothetical protein